VRSGIPGVRYFPDWDLRRDWEWEDSCFLVDTILKGEPWEAEMEKEEVWKEEAWDAWVEKREFRSFGKLAGSDGARW
jgi:hypothetical protein